MINVDDTFFGLQLTPMDSKLCNYYYSGGYMVLETITDYLLRVTENYRESGMLVVMYIPASTTQYTPAAFKAALAALTLKYYTFKNGVADSNFQEIVFSNSTTDNNFTDAYKNKLDSLNNIVFKISLPAASDVATRIASLVAGTDYPTGWTLAVDSGVNLVVTHNLGSSRYLIDVKVWETESGLRLAKPFSDAYSGILVNGSSMTIEGLDTLAVPLRIDLLIG